MQNEFTGYTKEEVCVCTKIFYKCNLCGCNFEDDGSYYSKDGFSLSLSLHIEKHKLFDKINIGDKIIRMKADFGESVYTLDDVNCYSLTFAKVIRNIGVVLRKGNFDEVLVEHKNGARSWIEVNSIETLKHGVSDFIAHVNGPVD